MEEILSSIRQIIADDDAASAAGPVRPVAQAGERPDGASDAASPREPEPDTRPNIRDDGVLPLSREQIVGMAKPDEAPQPADKDDPVVAEFLDPDDVAFEPGAEQGAPEPEAPALSAAPEAPPSRAAAEPTPRPASTPSMPDPSLSADMAAQLLEPATRAAVRSSIARLTNVGLGAQGVTLEDLTRELLRPMLKEWLDEHLPSVVERVVEKEIARISRGE